MTVTCTPARRAFVAAADVAPVVYEKARAAGRGVEVRFGD